MSSFFCIYCHHHYYYCYCYCYDDDNYCYYYYYYYILSWWLLLLLLLWWWWWLLLLTHWLRSRFKVVFFVFSFSISIRDWTWDEQQLGIHLGNGFYLGCTVSLVILRGSLCAEFTKQPKLGYDMMQFGTCLLVLNVRNFREWSIRTMN